MMTFKLAETLLSNRETKKVANNTYLVRQSNSDVIAVQHMKTIVVEIRRNGTWQIFNGGWKTKTTKDRINEFSPAGLYTKKGKWFLYQGGKNIPFEEGMILNHKGEVQS